MTDIDLKLNTGATIPALGLGTWQSKPGEVAAAVEHALVHSHYRHVDAAYVYQNEGEVGQGIKKALDAGAISREKLFVTTKVFPSFHNKVEESLNESLKNLGLDYVDLFLVHWPIGFNPNGNDPLFPTKSDGTLDYDDSFDLVKMYKDLEKEYKSGRVKAIGICNASIKTLEYLLPKIDVVPAVNQIELHPYLPQNDLVKFCESRGILIEAYSPLGSAGGPLLKEPEIIELAKKHKTEPATILISYHLSSGRVVLPKSVNPKRIDSNAQFVKLSKEDLEELASIEEKRGIHRYNRPEWADGRLGFPDW